MNIKHTTKHDMLKAAQLEASAHDEGFAYHYYMADPIGWRMISEETWIHAHGQDCVRVYIQQSCVDPDVYHYTMLRDDHACGTETEKGRFYQ